MSGPYLVCLEGDVLSFAAEAEKGGAEGEFLFGGFFEAGV